MNYLIIQISEIQVMSDISLRLQSATTVSAWLVKEYGLLHSVNIKKQLRVRRAFEQLPLALATRHAMYV